MASVFIQISALLLVGSCLILVHGAPQLQFDDQEEVANDGGLVEPLTRTRRGSLHQQPQAAFGHNHQTYHQPSYGHGHEHQQSYGHGHQSHGHGHGHQPIGPVFTFVRTDYNGNFQTGVRHKVGGGWRVGPTIIRFRRGYEGGHEGGGHGGHHGYAFLGPVHTFAKTDYNANFAWGVRHKVGGGYGHHG